MHKMGHFSLQLPSRLVDYSMIKQSFAQIFIITQQTNCTMYHWNLKFNKHKIIHYLEVGTLFPWHNYYRYNIMISLASKFEDESGYGNVVVVEGGKMQ
jgi:hypothetical protein